MAPRIDVQVCHYGAATDLLVQNILNWALSVIKSTHLRSSCLGLLERQIAPAARSRSRSFIVTTSGYGKNPVTHVRSRINNRLVLLQGLSAVKSQQLSAEFKIQVTIEVALLDETRLPYSRFPPADWQQYSDQKPQRCAEELIKRACDLVPELCQLCSNCDAQAAHEQISNRLVNSFIGVILRGRYPEHTDDEATKAVAQWLQGWLQEAQACRDKLNRLRLELTDTVIGHSTALLVHWDGGYCSLLQNQKGLQECLEPFNARYQQRTMSEDWIESSVAQRMLQALQAISNSFAQNAQNAWQHWQSTNPLVSSAAIRQLVSDVLVEIMQVYANAYLHARSLYEIIMNRAEVPHDVAKGWLDVLQTLYGKHNVALPESFSDVLECSHAPAMSLLSAATASAEGLGSADATHAYFWLELLHSGINNDTPSFVAFLDIFSRCAEDNASVYLLGKLADPALKQQWQRADRITLKWYSTYVVNGSLMQLDLCKVCDCAFVSRFEHLLGLAVG